jgi:hypothetical protein
LKMEMYWKLISKIEIMFQKCLRILCMKTEQMFLNGLSIT